MINQEVLGEKLMKGVKAGIIMCLKSGSCNCPEGGFTSSSDIWLDYIESSEEEEG